MNDSTRLEFGVVPGAWRPGLVGRHGAAWKFEPASRSVAGRVNQTVIRLCADVREKIVSFDKISEDGMDARLGAAASCGGAW